jgi:hypothetical protein
MFRVINWGGTLIGWALICFGVQELVVCTIGVYMVTTGQIQPGQRMFLELLAPEFWEGIEQLSGGLISLLFGAGSLYLVKMRKTSRLDDIARGKVKA